MNRDRVHEIDLLRFVAAISVVFFHYAFRGFAADGLSPMPYPALSHGAAYGYLGVELFFMISGFVILMTASGGSLRKFAVSRLVRLYPAFWVCCAITAMATLIFNQEPFSVNGRQFLINLTMLNGFFGVPSVDGVYWSLFVELKFYGLIALILLLRRIRQIEAILVAWLCISIANQFLKSGKLEYLLITNYAAFFIGGANFYLIWKNGVSVIRSLVIFFSWLLGCWTALKGVSVFPEIYGTTLETSNVLGIISCFFLVMLLVALRKTGIFLNRNWYVLGVMTYPLYLLHQNIGYMIFWVAYPAVNAHLLLFGTIFLMLLLSYGIHLVSERGFADLLRHSINNGLDRISFVRKKVP